jgi:hypothetical protein
MTDLFSTDSMLGVVQSLKVTPQYWIDRYFPTVQTEDTEEIHFDVIDKKRRLAPFVAPIAQGKIVQSQGFTTKTFKPAYIKDKRVFEGNRPFKRSAGEPIGGNLSPAARQIALVAYDLADQIDMVNRRLEVMAAECLRTGGVTITGDQYPTVNVSFGRAAGQTITLTGGNRWGQAGVNPLNLLQDWAQIVLQATGVMPTDVTMTVDVWKIFRADAEVQKRLDQYRGNSTMVQNAQIAEGGVFMGVVDGFNIWVYAGWYVDDAGSEQPILPAGSVVLASPRLDGVRAFGAIRDEEAGFQALPYYPKSWLEKDPSVRYLLLQSAPLVVPTRVNASLFATVL